MSDSANSSDDADDSSGDAFLREVARADERAPPHPDPTRIGRFVVHGRLGAGGMGIVYRAEDESLRRTVALKVLPSNLQHDEERRKRLVREARAAAAVTHPNLAAVHEVGEADGRVYIAMELVEGESLRARLAAHGGAVPLRDALAIATQIARGLSRAHRAGIVHRDLKPENVVVADDGHVKILDFGLAKVLAPSDDAHAGGETVTNEGRVLGTPAYMSPEQARGRDVTPASDIFAFGVMLHEMLAGKRPFTGATMADLVFAIDQGPAKVSTLCAEAPPPLDELLARCLAKDPGARPADGSALLVALTDLGPRDRISAAPPPRSRVLRVLVGAAAFLVIAATGAISLRSSSRAQLVAVDAAGPVTGSPAIVPTAVTDLPPPPTSNPQAAAEYAAGLQAYRDDSWAPALDHFERASRLDPNMAAAHLRAALLMWGQHWDAAAARHEHFSRAVVLRSQLTARDQAFVEAVEPILLRAREDPREAEPKLRALHERFPGDVELLFVLAELTPDPEARLALADQGIALDPKDGMSREERGQALKALGRIPEARATFEKAAEVSVTSVDPVSWLAGIDAYEGKCLLMEEHGRSIEQRGLQVTHDVIGALVANDRSDETLQQALARMLPKQPEVLRRPVELHTQAQLAMVRGDFEAARMFAKQKASLVAREPDLAQSLQRKFSATYQLIDIALETGDDVEVVRLAREQRARGEAWVGSSMVESDLLWVRRVAAGIDPVALASFAKERDRSAAEWAAKRTSSLIGVWLSHYADPAFTPADGALALEALPRFGSVHPLPGIAGDAAVGRVLSLGARPADALPFLRRAAADCTRYWEPRGHVVTALLLGDALTATGDREGACEAYGRVLGWWGNAKPRSVSADKARARRTQLRCK